MFNPFNQGQQTFCAALVGVPAPTRDRAPPETRRERSAWSSVRRAEQRYGRQLRDVASQIGKIIRGLAPDGRPSVDQMSSIDSTMRRYAEMLRPWARSVGAAMIADVQRRDEAVWAVLGQEMGRALRTEIATAPTGQAMRQMLSEQVSLITSLPTKAAERVHVLAQESLVTGARASEISKMILRSGDVTKSRATLIARTEVARAASGLVQARATHVGSEGYIWRTANDADVRRSHRGMAGKFVRWTEPPTLDNMVGHAGQLPNCRCFPEPVVPDFANIN